MESFSVDTGRRTEVVDVTDEVRERVPSDASGVTTVYTRHTTAAVVVQEAESRLMEDLERYVEGLAPDEGHRHNELDGNADSHLRATLLGPDVSIPVLDGELALGTWQSVLLVECDGPRTRECMVETVGSAR